MTGLEHFIFHQSGWASLLIAFFCIIGVGKALWDFSESIFNGDPSLLTSTTKCPRCDGTGFWSIIDLEADYESVCPLCSGKGYIYEQEEKEKDK